MAQESGYSYDLFISYASSDIEAGWVNRFCEGLVLELMPPLGRQPRLYPEWKDPGPPNLGDTSSLSAVQAAAALLVLATPGWLYSEGAQEELAAFDRRGGPIFVAEVLPTDDAAWPYALRDRGRFPFLAEADEESGLPDQGAIAYYEQLTRLAVAIGASLRDLEDPSAESPASPLPDPDQLPPSPDAEPARPRFTWVFYAARDQWAATWIRDRQPGRIEFWPYDADAFLPEPASGDTVVVLTGRPGGRSPGGQIVALAVVAADGSARFEDPRAGHNARRWPIVCAVALGDQPIERHVIESRVGPLINFQGGVDLLSPEAASAINARLAQRGLEWRVPFSDDEAQAFLNSSEPLTEALKAYSFLRYKSLPRWPPRVAGASRRAVRGAGGDGEADAMGGYVPFISDAPAEDEDRLDRGPLALFLARRLHLMWRQHNASGSSAHMRDQDSDTFIVHIDAPWGGGKTTFANFLTRVLNPAGEQLRPGHFLKSSLAPDVDDPDMLAKVPLDRVFLGDLEPVGDGPGHRPWIVVKTNAWRDQNITPPWWQLFLTISAGVRLAAGFEVRAALADLPGRRSAAAWCAAFAFGRWAGIVLAGFVYRLMNTKLLRQLFLTAVGTMLLFGLSHWVGKPLIDALNPGGVGSTQLKATLDIAVAVVGVVGGGFAALGTLFSQSLAPDIDFSDESKSIGVRDPIERFRRALNRILKLAGRPVLLVVDDLDRCEPSRVVEILRGFQTILRSSRMFVLVLGDRRWIETAHAVHHKDLANVNVGPETALGARFVEKLFPLSVTLPAMTPEARDRYVRAYLGPADEGPLTPRATAVSAPAPAAPPPGPAVTPELFAKVRAAAGAPEAMTQRERKVSEVLKAAGLKGENLERAREVAARQLVVASGADAGYQRYVRNMLTGLAAALPNNPRQIKRILNAFAIYETVGRLNFRYQVGAERGDEERARRWRQLALWVALHTDWPETWRTIARRPILLQAAYDQDPAARLAAEAHLGAKDATIAETLHRLRTHPQVRCLLAGNDTVPANWNDPVALFAATALEPAAVFEFNNIIWEPDFPLRPSETNPAEVSVPAVPQ
jgi:hypothetical protein